VLEALGGIEGRHAPQIGARLDRMLSGDARPAEVHQAVRALLELLAKDRPLVLVVENLHWADEASLEVIADVLRRAPNGPVLTVLSCRSGQWPTTLVGSLEASAARRELTEIHVSPLTWDGTKTLLGDVLDPATRRRIHRESGGNPFYALALARAGHREGISAGELPSALATTIAEDIDSLSPDALAVLRAAAVIGDSVDLDLATSVGHVDDADAGIAVAELAGRGLMRPASATQLEFRPPIVRRAVYEGMGLASRLAAHERTACLLAERGGSLEVRAHHTEHGGRNAPGDVALFISAGESALPANPPIAARWFTAALRRMPDGDERQLSTLICAAESLLNAGRIDEGREAFEKVDAMLPGLSFDNPRMLTSLARVRHMLGLAGPSRVALHQALEEDLNEGCAIGLRMALAMDHWRVGDRGEMARHARLAIDAATPIAGEDCLRACAVGLLGLAEYTEGRSANALGLVEEAEHLIGATPGARRGLLEALLLVGYLNHGLERYPNAAEHLERGIRLARESGNAYLLVPLYSGRAAVELATGRLGQACGTAAETLELASTIGGQQLLMWAHTLSALIAVAQGRGPAALEAAEHAAKAADGVATGFLTTAARCCLGVARIEAGGPRMGHELILRYGGGPGLDRLDAGIRPDGYASLAKAARLLGDLERAEEWVDRAEASAADLGLRGRTATAQAARARLVMEREPRQAGRLAAEAAEAFEAVGRMADAGRALTIAGQARVLTGDEAQAVSTLERAHGMLSQCGAERPRDLAARELRRLGRTISRPPGRGDDASTGVDALSRREREVAELVARGLTNKRIAEEMFVSAKTVEDHLTRAFAKLGVSSRAGLAAAIESGRRV
jgi:DNA-binding NarL/FixJ family response regulator